MRQQSLHRSCLSLSHELNWWPQLNRSSNSLTAFITSSLILNIPNFMTVVIENFWKFYDCPVFQFKFLLLYDSCSTLWPISFLYETIKIIFTIPTVSSSSYHFSLQVLYAQSTEHVSTQIPLGTYFPYAVSLTFHVPPPARATLASGVQIVL